MLSTFDLQNIEPLLQQEGDLPQGLDVPRQGPHRLDHIERIAQNHQIPPKNRAPG